jgi:hypothetical protein
MTANTGHYGVGGGTALADPPADQVMRAALLSIDWRAARRAGRACCCPAKPAVIAVIPPSADRPRATDLLLCGHHYRLSREALRRVGAVVLDMQGVPAEGSPWPQAGCRAG